MNPAQIKNHLDDFDKHYPIHKLVLYFGLLPTAIFFPINLFFNPNVSPIVKDSPLFLGFGVLAFIAMFLVLSVGSLFVIRFAIDGYLAYGRFNANSMLVNDQAPREFSRRTEKYLFEGLRNRFIPIFDEIKAGLRHEFKEDRKESDKLFMDEYRKVNLELQTERNLRKELQKQLEEYKRKDSVKIQEIGEKFQAQDINENTKIDNKNKKFESQD